MSLTAKIYSSSSTYLEGLTQNEMQINKTANNNPAKTENSY